MKVKLNKSAEALINGLLKKWQRASDISDEWPEHGTPCSNSYNYSAGRRSARADCMQELRDTLRTGKLPEWPEIPETEL